MIAYSDPRFRPRFSGCVDFLMAWEVAIIRAKKIMLEG